MTERKRRKVADALSRLTASVGDIRALGEELSAIVKPDGERKPLPLRVVAPPAPYPQPPLKKAATTATASASLMSLVAASTLQLTKDTEEKEAQKNWRTTLAQLAKQLAAADPEAHDRCSRLMRRYDSLVGTVNFYEAKLKQQSNDVVLTEKVQSRLEQEESAWEEAMEEREVQVAQLKVELRQLQQYGEEEEEQKDDAEADMVIESEVAAMENHGLREALALRMEEKRDIEAAIQSLRRKKRRRDVPMSASSSDQVASPLRDELVRLTAENEELQAAIYSMEAEQEQAETEQQGVAAVKEALEQHKLERQQVQDELDKQRHFLTRIKAKMTRMVDVQLMAARDTNPPTISEEMVILHLLYEHAGEMEMNELKKATTDMLATYGKTTSSAAVVRALYSLVASLAVHIDRTMGNGVVTSLLV